MNKKAIRTKILNIPLFAWQKIKLIEEDGIVRVTPQELISLIGFSGGMFLGVLANDEEKQFIEDFYRIGRNQKNKTNEDNQRNYAIQYGYYQSNRPMD